MCRRPLLMPLLLPLIAWGAPLPAAPLNLDDCLHMALEKNPRVRSAREGMEKAQAQIDEQSASAWPELSLSADYTRMGNIEEYDFGGQKIAFAPEDNYKAALNLRQKLYAPQVFAAIQASKTYAKGVETEHKIAREETVATVKKAFYRYLFAAGMISVREEAAAQLARHVEDVRVRLDVGLATDYDLLRAEVRHANTLPLVARARDELRIAGAALRIVLGLPQGEPLEVEGALAYTPYEITLEEALSVAREKRPELKRLDYQVETLRGYVKVAKKEMLPQVSLHGSYSYANDGMSTGGESEWNKSWNVGVTLDYKLFDGWKRSARVRQNRSDLGTALISRGQTADTVALEVETALAALDEARVLIGSQEKNVENASRAFEIAKIGNDNGIITELELLDAQLELTEAKSNYRKAVFDWLTARAELDRAVGTGLEALEERRDVDQETAGDEGQGEVADEVKE